MEQFKIGELYDDSFKKLSPQERKDNLEAVCYEGQEKNYTKNLSEEEILDRKEEFAELGLELKKIEDRKKEILDEIKEKSKPKKERSKELLSAIQYKSELRYGLVYSVDDQDKGMMYFFDEGGYCIDARPLTRQERQTKLKTINS